MELQNRVHALHNKILSRSGIMFEIQVCNRDLGRARRVGNVDWEISLTTKMRDLQGRRAQNERDFAEYRRLKKLLDQKTIFGTPGFTGPEFSEEANHERT